MAVGVVQLDEIWVLAELEEVDLAALESFDRNAERLHKATVTSFVLEKGAEGEHGAVGAHACNADEGGGARLRHEKVASVRCGGQRSGAVDTAVRASS